jgi:cell division septation protein DedD
MINKICDLALTAAYATNSDVVDSDHFKAACSELIELQKNGHRHFPKTPRRLRSTLITWAALLASMAIGFGANIFIQFRLDLHEGTHTQVIDFSDVTEGESTLTTIPEPICSKSPTAPIPTNKLKAYILQLGSFNTLATALRAVDIYSQKGIQAHWNIVDMGEKGIWYRVFVGRYASIEETRHDQNKMDLAEAQIIFAPWAVVLGHFKRWESALTVKDRLKFHGLDSYTLTAQDGSVKLCSGAFISQARAAAMARQIQEITGFHTHVVNFQTAFWSNPPNDSKATTGDPL